MQLGKGCEGCETGKLANVTLQTINKLRERSPAWTAWVQSWGKGAKVAKQGRMANVTLGSQKETEGTLTRRPPDGT